MVTFTNTVFKTVVKTDAAEEIKWAGILYASQRRNLRLCKISIGMVIFFTLIKLSSVNADDWMNLHNFSLLSQVLRENVSTWHLSQILLWWTWGQLNPGLLCVCVSVYIYLYVQVCSRGLCFDNLMWVCTQCTQCDYEPVIIQVTKWKQH